MTKDEIVLRGEELKVLLKAIDNKYGYDFSQYSQVFLQRRFVNFMIARKLRTTEELSDRLLRDEQLFEDLIPHISITVTEMFRDPFFYRGVREKIVPRLATYPFIKVWIAGCATGEEAYSIAILLKEHNLLGRSVIYATDINQRALQAAREGMYQVRNMKQYTENYIRSGGTNSFSEYYTARYDFALFDRTLANKIVFAPHNLVTDNAFNEFQLIVCRNVLIYFNEDLQNRVTSLFYDSLCNFGFLALGNKESLLFMDKKDRFQEVDRKEKIFIKKG